MTRFEQVKPNHVFKVGDVVRAFMVEEQGFNKGLSSILSILSSMLPTETGGNE